MPRREQFYYCSISIDYCIKFYFNKNDNSISTNTLADLILYNLCDNRGSFCVSPIVGERSFTRLVLMFEEVIDLSVNPCLLHAHVSPTTVMPSVLSIYPLLTRCS